MSDPAPERRAPQAYYSFLLGLFPIVSMFSTNIGEVRVAELGWPLAIYAVIWALAWVALLPVLPDRHKRALCITAFWLLFYAYGAVVDSLRAQLNFREMLSPVQLAVAAIPAGGAGIAALLWYRRASLPVARLTRPLNVLAVCAIMVALVQAGARMRDQASYVPAFATVIDPVTTPLSPSPPLADIYVVVLDAYARADYLKSRFEYDNAPFLDALRERGFYIAERSRSNYTHTQMSLASAFNLSYLDESVLASSETDWDATIPKLAGMIWRNVTVDLLRREGYRFVTLSTGVVGTEIRTADEFIRPDGFRLSEFQKELMELTPLRSVYNRLERPERLHTIYVLDRLDEFTPEPPVFAFAHLIDPHLAHTFDANGQPLDEPPPYEQGYRDVVTYLNKRLIAMVDRKLAHNPNTIFVFMGDHGPWSDWRGDRVLPWEGTREDFIRDRTANLMAIRLPDEAGRELLYPEVTPVNVFRAVLNAALGAQFERLEDVSYVSFTEGGPIERIETVH